LEEEAALSVLKTADLLRRNLERRLSPHGIGPQQYNILRILRGAGEAGIATLAIGDRLIESTPGMTRLLDRMEEKGLARRERCRQDRRQVLCYSTPRGEELLKQLDPLVLELNRLSFAGIEKAELERLIELLECARQGSDPQSAPYSATDGKQVTEG
jgi:DNA-binding MarR family transcriptional regulator